MHETKLPTSGISCCSIDKDDLAELNLRELGRIVRTCEPRTSVKFDAAAAKVHTEWPALTAWLGPGFFFARARAVMERDYNTVNGTSCTV